MRAHNNKPIGLRIRYLMFIDLGCILLAIVASFVVRYEALISVWPYLRGNWTLFVLVPLIRLPVYYGFRLYRRLWRYASMREFKVVVLAGIVASALVFIANFGLLPLLGIYHCPSRSILVLEGGLSIAFLGGTRFLLRLLQERMTREDATGLKAFVQNPRRVLIVGAGDAGAMILREMQHNPGLGLQAVGFVDDDHAKLHMRIHGVPVLGTREDIPALAKRCRIDQAIIAMPTASGKAIKDTVAFCKEASVSFKTIPGIYELLEGSVSVSQIRDIQLEDLLRRETIHTDVNGIGRYLGQARVLVTGAGGSIGSELCRQIASHNPHSLILLDHSENSIYGIDLELREGFPRLEVQAVVADTRDRDRVERIVATFRPAVIFHAAAYKHVPLMEANAVEAITSNVIGTLNMIRAAEAYGVKRFVLISTDKAVNPVNIMGATKRIAERLVLAAAKRNGEAFVAVRFGNVLGSRGSVVPRFKRQIASGGPITITHPDMRRYFMTIPEAVQLVIQAAALGPGGGIYVLDMGEQVKIVDLARDLIELSGLEVGRDIDIVFTGVRPGEKISEELFAEGEEHSATGHENICVVHDESLIDGHRLEADIHELERTAREMDGEKIRAKIKEIVPEFRR